NNLEFQFINLGLGANNERVEGTHIESTAGRRIDARDDPGRVLNGIDPGVAKEHAGEKETKEHFTATDWLYEEAELKGAITNIEFYGFVAAGLRTLHSLAVGGNAEARDYLDPLRSTLPISTNYKAAHAFAGHFQALGDHVSAMHWYRRAATEANYHESQVSYAAYLVTGKALAKPDPGLGIVQLMKAWETGRNKDAALALGEAYAKGVGVPHRDVQKSVAWYKKAWDAGRFADAAYVVGFSYGTGVLPFSAAVDPADAAAFAAARKQNPLEKNNGAWNSSGLSNININETLALRMGTNPPLLDENPAPSLSSSDVDTETKTVTQQTPTDSQAAPSTPNTANVLLQQNTPPTTPPQQPSNDSLIPKFVNPIPCDYGLAVQWYQKAANLNHPRACNNLAELYMTGRGVEIHDSTGFKYFKKASEAGLPEGHYNLGRCYYTARGCWENKKKAEELFRMAEVAGIAEATKSLEPYRNEVIKQRTGGCYK
ncbi:hypothetical protein HK100_003583, partial [Physocladia obscura]